MENKIVVANMKMNLEIKDISSYLKKIEEIEDENFIVCPSNIYIPYFLKKKYKVGSQNCHFEKGGAFTGEVSPKQLKSLGVEYVIIGHSERRNIFKEDDILIKKKVVSALEENLKVIFCIGETLEEREMGRTLQVIKRQMLNVLPNLQKNIIVAYEPVWSIGTGKIPTNEEIEEVISYIKKVLRELELESKVLYGGSVSRENISELQKTENVDGFLIGGASIDAEHIIDILNIIKTLR